MLPDFRIRFCRGRQAQQHEALPGRGIVPGNPHIQFQLVAGHKRIKRMNDHLPRVIFGFDLGPYPVQVQFNLPRLGNGK